MKKIILLLILINITSCSVTRKNIKENEMIDAFEVIKINKIENTSIYYVKRRDSVFKVISNYEIVKNCDTIVVGKKYELELLSTLGNLHPSSKLRIKGMKEVNNIIYFESDGTIRDIFVDTIHIKGRCYISK